MQVNVTVRVIITEDSIRFFDDQLDDPNRSEVIFGYDPIKTASADMREFARVLVQRDMNRLKALTKKLNALDDEIKVPDKKEG